MTDGRDSSAGTDDADARMDARLSRAGAVWRASAALDPGTATPPEPVAVGGPQHLTRRRPKVLLVASAAVVAAVLVLAGTIAVRELGSPRVGTGGPITATVWKLLGYGSGRIDPSSSATFYLGSDGGLVADDTCEVVTADATPAGGTLHVTGLLVRDRGCTDSVGETTFTQGLDVLRSNPAYSVAGDELTIGSGSEAMHLRAIPGALPPTSDIPTFEQSRWRLVSGRDTRGTYRAGPSLPLLSVEGTRLRTGTGSTTLRADVTIDASRVTIDDLVTGSSGPDETNPLDGLVAKVYATGSFTQVVSGSGLTVVRPHVGTLVYRWVPRDRRATQPSVLTDRTWRLQSAAGSSATAAADLRISADGTLRGVDGCRPIRGHAAIEAGSMTITGVAQSDGRPRCTDRGAHTDANQAATVDSFLQGDVLWSVRAGRLWIDPAGGSQAFSLVFAPAPDDRPVGPPPEPGYAGRWQVVAVRPAHHVHRTPLHPGLTLRLDEFGYRQSSPCGHESGPVSSSRVRIDFGRPATSSFHTCPYTADRNGPLGQLAARLLTGRVRWSINGTDDLVLRRGGASVVLGKA